METSASSPQGLPPGQRPGVATKIMFVEDDAVVARVYIQKLTQSGFEVAYAEDGVVALKQMPAFKPDLVILDLVMPRMTGPDVLRFIRQNADLKSTRVIVFSNSFLSNQVEQVAAMGVELALVKSAVTPAILVDEIHKVLGTTPETVAAPAPAAAPEPESATSQPAPESTDQKESDTAFLSRIDRQFLERTPVVFNELRGLCQEFLAAADAPSQADRLTALRRKLGFLIQISAMAGYQRTAELASALDALVFELLSQPALINDSTGQTIASTITLLARVFESNASAPAPDRRQAAVMIVDDNAGSNRAVVEALEWAQIPATSLANPLEALQKLQQTKYDVVLLDIGLPGMGTALCEQMRTLPLNNKTPVIFVTSHADFPNQAEAILGAGNDLIAKPISAAELCVKVMGHLLKAG